MIVRGTINNNEVNYFIDTGSQATLVSKPLINKLGLQSQVRPTNCTLSSFTKNAIPALGEITLNLTIAGMCASHICIVSDLLDTDVLLGMDYMGRYNITLQLGRGTITSDFGSSTFLQTPKCIPGRTKIRATETTIIPPNTVMFIKGSMQDKALSHKATYGGYIEPYENLTANTHVLIAGAMVYSENGAVPIQSINLSDDPVVIHKHKLLGFMEPHRSTNDNQRLRGIKVHRIKSSSYNPVFEDPAPTKKLIEWSELGLFKALKIEELDISSEEKARMKEIVWKYRHCFSTHAHDLGNCNFFEAEINLKPDFQPKWVPSRPVPYKLRDEMNSHIQGLLEADVIEPCQTKSYWNSPVFLVPKPHQPGKYRFVADFRAVNSECLPDNYELPNVNYVVDKIGGSTWYSKLDMCQSYHQVSYGSNRSREVTSFTCNDKRYWFKKMVMGHMTSSNQFSRMMAKLLDNIPLDQLCYFLDDLLLASDDVTSHLDRLETVLKKFAASNLKLTPSKCEFMKKQIDFVGLTISKEGLKITDGRVKSVLELKSPRSRKETQRVLGFLGYNRRFLSRYSALSKPIYALLDKTKKFEWTSECESRFEEIKQKIAESITLCLPDVEDPLNSFHVTLDASIDGYGATLSQMVCNERRIVAYYSKSVPRHKKEWGQTKLEFQAMFNAIEHWKIYLKGTKFTVITDCASLLNLSSIFAKADPTMIRKIQKLAQYRFSIQHIAGKELHNTADFLSRYLHKRQHADEATQTTAEDLLPTSTSHVNMVSELETEIPEQDPLIPHYISTFQRSYLY